MIPKSKSLLISQIRSLSRVQINRVFFTNLTQIIQTSSTTIIIRITPPAMPPVMQKNSDFSVQCLPVKLPLHLHEGCPRESFRQTPSLSQKPRHTSVHTVPVPLYPGLHSHLKSLVSGISRQYALASQCISSPLVSQGFVQSVLLVC